MGEILHLEIIVFLRRPNSLPDWFQQTFDDSEQLQKDLITSFNGIVNHYFYDVCFIVGENIIGFHLLFDLFTSHFGTNAK